ncbi:MAG TPA: hypothetical protein DEB37_14100 [Lysinibacillus sp.]|nr:hypothetical protein [Lysinibacillus sp.]
MSLISFDSMTAYHRLFVHSSASLNSLHLVLLLN